MISDKLFEREDLPDIIKACRRTNYNIAEGFYNSNVSNEDIGDDAMALLLEPAEKLAAMAGVSVIVAASTILELAIKEFESEGGAS